jgi:hypothetical protein
MLYELKFTDGRVSRMRLLDPETDIQTELSKWPSADRELVVSWSPIAEAPERGPALIAPVDLSSVPDSTRKVLTEMIDALSVMQGQRDRDQELMAALNLQRQQDASMISELHLRTAQLEDTNARVRAELKI